LSFEGLGSWYRAGHHDFGDGVVEWDGLLLDGWKPHSLP
jgi:hypothetical protein